MREIPRFLPKWKILVPAFWLAFAMWIGILIWVSNLPSVPGPATSVLGVDKVEHFVFFAGGAMALGAAIRSTFTIRWATLFLIVIVALSFFGLADEIHQLFVTGRSGGDPFDWLADLTGSACGLALLRTLYVKRPSESANPGTPGTNRQA